MFIDNKHWESFGKYKTKHLIYQYSICGPWYSVCGERGETERDIDDDFCKECERILRENQLG